MTKEPPSFFGVLPPDESGSFPPLPDDRVPPAAGTDRLAALVRYGIVGTMTPVANPILVPETPPAVPALPAQRPSTIVLRRRVDGAPPSPVPQTPPADQGFPRPPVAVPVTPPGSFSRKAGVAPAVPPQVAPPVVPPPVLPDGTERRAHHDQVPTTSRRQAAPPRPVSERVAAVLPPDPAPTARPASARLAAQPPADFAPPAKPVSERLPIVPVFGSRRFPGDDPSGQVSKYELAAGRLVPGHSDYGRFPRLSSLCVDDKHVDFDRERNRWVSRLGRHDFSADELRPPEYERYGDEFYTAEEVRRGLHLPPRGEVEKVEVAGYLCFLDLTTKGLPTPKVYTCGQHAQAPKNRDAIRKKTTDEVKKALPRFRR